MDREALARSISIRLNAIRMEPAEFSFFKPEDVFKKPMPRDALAAFFILSDIDGMETARHFCKLRGKIPPVIISDSDEYGIEALNFGNVYYLLRPYSDGELDAAIIRCTEGNFRKKYI